MKSLLSLLIFPMLLVACNMENDRADAFGNFEAIEIMVASQANGPILQFNVEEGQQLASGQVVGYVDTIALDLKLQQLAAQREAVLAKNPGVASQIAVLNQQIKNAQVDQQRIKNMLSEGAATQKQLDDINGQLNVLQKQILSVTSQNATIAAELKSMDAQIAMLHDQIARSYIINPQAGTVLMKYAELSEITSAGKNLYKIGDLRKMELRAYISGSQLAAVKIGAPVRVKYDTEDGSMGETKGQVTWISATAEFTPKIVQTKEQRTNLVYAIKVAVDNANGQLKIGMPGEMFLN
jgi:HlyD family secretion protein